MTLLEVKAPRTVDATDKTQIGATTIWLLLVGVQNADGSLPIVYEGINAQN